MIGMRKHIGVTEALLKLCPDAQFSVRDDEYNKIEWFSPDIKKPSRKLVEATISELKIDEPIDNLRQIRDWLLRESDWTQGHDIRLVRGAEWCAAWDAYRQELRDITGVGFDLSFDEMDMLVGFVLPVAPSHNGGV
jgi:hypothetical protein